MGGWWGQCRICSRDSNKGSSGTAWHGMNRMSVSLYYVALSVVLKRNFMNDIGKEILIVRWWYSFFLFFFFCCCFRFLPMYSTISVRKQWYVGASGKCISFTQANSDGGDDKTTKCTKEFPYFPFVFIFLVYVSERVGVCVCVVTVVWHCGITVWNVTTIYKGMTFVKWLGKTLLKWCINMCSLSSTF